MLLHVFYTVLQGLFLGFTLGLQYHWFTYDCTWSWSFPFFCWLNPHSIPMILGLNVYHDWVTHIYTSYCWFLDFIRFISLVLSREWGNGTIINGYYRSFPHSLLSTGKVMSVVGVAGHTTAIKKTTAPSASWRPKRRPGVLGWPNGRACCLRPVIAVACFFSLLGGC